MKNIITHVEEQYSKLEDHPVIGGLFVLGSFAVMGIVAARVVKKQSRAAQLRKEHPGTSYHQSVCQAFDELGYEQPFKV